MLNIAKMHETANRCATVAKNNAHNIDRRIVAAPSRLTVSIFRNTFAENLFINDITLNGIGLIFKAVIRNYEK